MGAKKVRVRKESDDVSVEVVGLLNIVERRGVRVWTT